ncbi:AraC family transcriptional regulator [Paenibacillus sp. UNC451MF]|uniref:AraC family transcriptional regulator n=1 Tax=Paenibacillus sp. UNC451MF TaxID=1449063 RepID=UPI0004915696|nr:helix-turn-helix domain-containing protein [Paenibacillus sp. UNC451MF]
MRNVYWNMLTEIDLNLPLYVASTGQWVSQPELIRKDGYKRFQWLQCIHGQGVLEICGKTITVSKGQGMLLFPEVPHAYWPVIEPWTLQWVDFDGKWVNEILRSFNFYESTVLYMLHLEPFLARFNEMNTIVSMKKNKASFDSSHHLYGLFLDLFQYTSSSENRSNHEQFEQLKPALQYIEQHFTNPISLQDLADQLSVTTHYTCVLFQQTLGTRPVEYINRYRIRKAKELLLQEEFLEVKTISEKVGFGNPSYFINTFKKNEGLTPRDFRRLHQLK